MNRRRYFLPGLAVLLAVSFVLLTGECSQSAELEFEYPTDGMTFHANDLITVRLTTPTGKQFKEVTVRFYGKAVYEGISSQPPYEFSIYLPFKVGTQQIIASGEDLAGEFFKTVVTVNLESFQLPSGITVQELLVEPQELSLEYVSDEAPIFVKAILSDGSNTDKLDVTKAVYGTTYQVQNGGNSVVAVSPDGVVTAKSGGQAVILVNNNGVTKEVQVTVTGQATNSPPKVDPVGDLTSRCREMSPRSVRGLVDWVRGTLWT